LDEFQLPGMDYDPDAEPEGTVRMDGPVTSLLVAQSAGPSDTPSWDGRLDFGDLATAAEIAIGELLRTGEEETKSGPPVAAPKRAKFKESGKKTSPRAQA